jgi:hypothetical protein
LVLNDPEGFSRIGPTPYFAAVFAFVNLHHYFMDAVLWRRDNPEMRLLGLAAAGPLDSWQQPDRTSRRSSTAPAAQLDVSRALPR